MKPSLTFVTVLLGLAAAAPQSDPDPSKYGLSKDFPDRIKKTLEDLKAQKQDVGKVIGDVAQQVGWQVTGSLPGAVGKGATILSFLTSLKDLNNPPTQEQAKDVLKNFASAAIAFVPTFGALGGLPGFLGIMKTITIGIFNAEFPELAAKAEMKEKCFSDEATYEDLCNNCQPHLTVSWLGRLNGCTKDKVVRRNGHQDHVRAQAFCSAVFCSGYNGGETDQIIGQGTRYDPLRAFWCASKDEQIGLLLSSWIGGSLLENIHLLNTDDFRNAMRPACSELLKDEKDVCPSKEVFQKAEEDFPSLTFCSPGKVHKSRQ